MKISIKVTYTFVLLFAIQLSIAQTEYGTLSFNKAVNISGKQRMLTQRMGKIYLYLLNNPTDYMAKRDMKIAQIIFEKQNNILEENTSSNVTKNNIKEVKNTWVKYDKFLKSYPNKGDALKIINTNSTILSFTNNVVNAIILEANIKNNNVGIDIANEDNELKQIINKSGRQRMLSQRLVLYYFANGNGLKSLKSQNMLRDVYEELDSTLSDLLISSFNNDRIDNALGDVMAKWEGIQKSNERLFKQGYEDKEIYDLSNDLTKLFNRVTNLYEKLKVE
ncbi:Type IV pili methyl-accepting chemotaxis transducer N-term [Tenacibaculum sp. MAR_2009_124]|uniref:type IV pili methyl-accepting chemotaxis transducer N-terminal domain-containing protein n=1 Tax=Tenacibaculum sp. MAR_2009_124 TaxID=1250059 RepID=UPI00089C0EB9|nr:type IV pili methyl-accepting chemotaxis transducer N-terminal domain-containing protein [Tenacibaculum sp. MAR_2009_124]SED17354.1 Type IV pili methyl-accepting chemotaxis transducer N-term [Tenacibaculum sp. MAR_2009_124]